MKILLIFTLCLISDGGESKEVTGFSGGGVLITCKYDTKYTQNQKYFCKGSWPVCSDLIKTGDKNKWVNPGRFSLFDETKSAEFRVMIRELTVQDTGTYHCGVDKDFVNDIYIPVNLKIKKGGVASREVKAYTGGGVNIKCRYEKEYSNKPKYFCKIGEHRQCLNRKETKLNSEWSHDGRFSIHDNRSAGFFSVFIREMITEDTGTYRCAVVVSDEIEIFTVVKLNVGNDTSYRKSINETVHAGGNLTVGCEYPESLSDGRKFLCKRLQTAACSHKISVKKSRQDVRDGKFSFHKETAERLLTVSIRNVSEQDSGEYWCGAEVSWTSDHGYKVYFTRIDLTVTAAPSEPKQPSRVSSSPTSSPVLLLSSLQPTPNIIQTGLSPLSIVITVLVNILIGLLIGSICLFVILRIKSKIQASRNKHEKVKDTTGVFASETGTSTGDCADIYANTVSPRNAIDSANTANADQLPTSLSDSSTSAVKTPADDLTYAAVRFQHSASSPGDAAPEISFNKKEEVSCEYATVSHANSYG